MPSSVFTKSRISAIACSIPDIMKTIDDEIELYGGNKKQVERIKNTIGINRRYVADEKTTAADLCQHAGEKLFEETGIDRNSIDTLIVVTQTPDYFIPATSCYLHGRLKLNKNCSAFDVNLGCSGYIYGLWLASMMIETESCNNVLLLVGDTVSKCVNNRDRAVAPLFGDAAAATLVQRSDQKEKAYFMLHTDGTGFNHLIIPAGGFRYPKDETTAREFRDEDGNIRSKNNLYMNGAEIFNFSIKTEPEAIKKILEFSGYGQGDIDYIIFHQANKYIISNIVRRLKFSKKKAPDSTVEKYGNQSGASIPVTICESIKSEIENSRKKVIMSGFGTGLSWASCLTDLDHVQNSIHFYKSCKK